MENCMKLEVLLHRATYIFRELFLIRWRLTHEGREWINCEKTGQEFIAGFGKHVYDQASPQVKECLRSGDVTQWDITTLARVLRQSEYPFADIGNPWFDRRVRRENDKIRRLILVRNRVVHHPTKNISDTDFNTWWNEVSELLVSLGDSKIVLNRWKQFSLEDLLKPTNAIENIVLDKGHNIKPKPARPKTGANKGTTNNPTSTSK